MLTTWENVLARPAIMWMKTFSLSFFFFFWYCDKRVFGIKLIFSKRRWHMWVNLMARLSRWWVTTWQTQRLFFSWLLWFARKKVHAYGFLLIFIQNFLNKNNSNFGFPVGFYVLPVLFPSFFFWCFWLWKTAFSRRQRMRCQMEISKNNAKALSKETFLTQRKFSFYFIICSHLTRRCFFSIFYFTLVPFLWFLALGPSYSAILLLLLLLLFLLKRKFLILFWLFMQSGTTLRIQFFHSIVVLSKTLPPDINPIQCNQRGSILHFVDFSKK